MANFFCWYNIYVLSLTQQYFIIQLIGNKFQLLDHHMVIIT